MQEPISNPASERAILAGIFNYGSEAFIDVDDIVSVKSFTIEENQIIYSCLKKALETANSIDLPSLLSAASSLGFDSVFDKKISPNHIRSITNLDIELENVRQHAVKIKKLEIARDIRYRARRVQNDIIKVTGDESVDELISIGETPFFELSSSLNDSVDEKPVALGEEIEDYILHLEENPTDMLGLSSGLSRFDTAIGGGFRRKCVDLIAARPKVGKSMLADNIAMHISGTLDTPVLMLDTEMSKEDHWNRLLANFSGIQINDIATGSFMKMSGGKERVEQASEKLKNIPFDYISIAGKTFEETLSIIRRWIIRKVGFDENGRANDCMLIYDYLKLMHSEQINDNLAEFQVLGFQITQLHNFTVRYDVPCLAFVQLNRDGITKETTDVVSGSDRLIWLCSSFTIFKNKSDEEIAEDQGKSGNKKLVPVVARHGGGLSDDYDYINISMQGEIAQVMENETKSELLLKNRKGKDGFDNEIDNSEKPF
ncbi:hypothetical protein CL634_07710 [bacterium]|nr:hypothetical protein [bacterium]|tara:strand:- start:528 stop:1985 length:1458 start_codon:yes stop_codon:yes gene_type:complete